MSDEPALAPAPATPATPAPRGARNALKDLVTNPVFSHAAAAVIAAIASSYPAAHTVMVALCPK